MIAALLLRTRYCTGILGDYYVMRFFLTSYIHNINIAFIAFIAYHTVLHTVQRTVLPLPSYRSATLYDSGSCGGSYGNKQLHHGYLVPSVPASLRDVSLVTTVS